MWRSRECRGAGQNQEIKNGFYLIIVCERKRKYLTLRKKFCSGFPVVPFSPPGAGTWHKIPVDDIKIFILLLHDALFSFQCHLILPSLG